ncbi:hypothetical protein C922_05336 [Plasmodium inui San Antonio 1]|uniref:Uncharacterized protein n=1 Tax=Plasmodium inui San Antonio 1 TaxID=1237626 RepID=W7AG59_9APIC|nr:hypothetical protein C922_05336 [Plasmodium inui San Antonio 1]EUD64291.1 hypothetical protein C922_05336 [Plasmodium inui San Antonio 1]
MKLKKQGKIVSMDPKPNSLTPSKGTDPTLDTLDWTELDRREINKGSEPNHKTKPLYNISEEDKDKSKTPQRQESIDPTLKEDVSIKKQYHKPNSQLKASNPKNYFKTKMQKLVTNHRKEIFPAKSPNRLLLSKFNKPPIEPEITDSETKGSKPGRSHASSIMGWKDKITISTSKHK